MKKRELIVLVASLCLLTPWPRSVPGQVVQPVADRPEKAERPEQRGGEPGAARLPVRVPGRGAQLTDEDVQDVMVFMRVHSPNRVRAMEGLPEDSSARRGVMAFVVARYRALQAVKDEDPQLYDLNVKQVEIEDELYGLLAPVRTVGDREKLRDRIRDAVKRQMETNLAEREHRLNRLRESVQREERRLDSDRSQLDQLTDTRTNALIQEGTPALRRDGLRRAIRDDARRDGRSAGTTRGAAEK